MQALRFSAETREHQSYHQQLAKQAPVLQKALAHKSSGPLNE